MIVLLIAATAAMPTRSSQTPTPPLPRGEARTMMERQLQSPPRQDARGGVSAEEADRIVARYLASIGVLMQPRDREGPQQ